MKNSKYNIFFDYENVKIGFNSYSREYIALEPLVYLMYESAIKTNDFSEIEEYHPEFYKFLIEKGFLIENHVDELQKVKDLVHKIDNDESIFELHINPTMNCNFKCWYCYETHIKDSKMDIETIERTFNLVQNVINQKKDKLEKIKIGWFGGEPLLYYKKVIVPLLQKVRDLCDSNNIQFFSSITTNGFLINDFLLDSAKSLGLNFFQITLDGNQERHNEVRFVTKERGSYKTIVSNIKKLTNNQYDCLIRINCSPQTIPGIYDILEDFKNFSPQQRKHLTFDFHKVWQDTENVSDETLSEIRRNFRESKFTVASSVYDTVLNSCYGDHKNHATINYNGEVFKCTARDFSNENHEGILENGGSISWNDKFNKRLNSKFKNKPCLDCSILPICNGGCSQQAIEHEGKDYCVHNFDEHKKRQLVIEKFLEMQY